MLTVYDGLTLSMSMVALSPSQSSMWLVWFYSHSTLIIQTTSNILSHLRVETEIPQEAVGDMAHINQQGDDQDVFSQETQESKETLPKSADDVWGKSSLWPL